MEEAVSPCHFPVEIGESKGNSLAINQAKSCIFATIQCLFSKKAETTSGICRIASYVLRQFI